MEGVNNLAYHFNESDEIVDSDIQKHNNNINKEGEVSRDNWGSGIEFLFSCVAMSVGLGNVWRFPFIALDNGGGAFLIPYIIVLVLVGRPGYYLEMIIGQFSSREIIKAFDCVPAMRGIGIGQVICVVFISTYYSSILAITLRYFFFSFNSVLPWSECDLAWAEPCYPSSGSSSNQTIQEGTKSSAELYFLNEVLHAKQNINDGIGLPILNLLGFLVLNWTIVFLILVKGIKSAGKVSYVTGIAPFIFLIIFLIRALTLPGSIDGIIYFFKPDWNNLLKPSVWYSAVTQLFFSLNVFFANIVMYASYNKFNHNIHRDANIVTTLDTLTSIVSGCISFGIIGHLKHELNADDITKVFKGGPGLVFVTYPETISKFQNVPQLFSVLFFIMLFILGIGSIVAMVTSVITVVRDQFPKVKYWQAALGYAIFGTLCGSLYLTPGGQSVLGLVDHYGATFIAFILALFEIISFCHIYGVKRICKHLEFMLGFQPSAYWKICWYAVTPLIMGAIVVYSLAFYEPPTDNGQDYPFTAHIIGWCITFLGLIWFPLIMFVEINKQTGQIIEKIKAAFRPKVNWGPLKAENYEKYQEFIKNN
ncbi:hypothetical protein ACKWTF_012396 [Chironomus riparius]